MTQQDISYTIALVGYSGYHYNSVDNGFVDVGNVTSIEYDNLPGGAYFMKITAYDGIGESWHSNEVSYYIGVPIEPPTNLTASVEGNKGNLKLGCCR